MAVRGPRQQEHGDEVQLTGRQKAAILMISLGPDLSSQIFRNLKEDEIEALTLEIASLRNLRPELIENVVREFSELAMAHEYISQGGMDYAQELLDKALGGTRASDIVHRLTASLQVRPFDFARKADPSQLLNFIQHEHPQTIALILAYLEPSQAGQILSALAPDRQVDVAKRLATLDRTTPEVLEEVEGALEKRLSSFLTQDFTKAGGVDVAVEILNRVDRATEKTIMETLEEEDPELAEEIRQRMFVFEDIVQLDDRSLREVIREVDLREWALALKTSSEEVGERVFKNMSRRQGETLREEMDYLGPVRLRDVEEAQQKVVGIIRRLEEAGEIVVARGGEDEIVV